MMTTISETSAGATAARGVSRPLLYALTMAVLIANAIASKAVDTVAQLGAAGALANGLGLSWAFWLAYAVCIRLALREPASEAQPKDLWICGVCALVALVPLSPLAGVACTVLAVAMLLDRTAAGFLKAAAMVLLAISIQVVWSRALMLFFLQPVASLDAHLVGLIIHRPVHGNLVEFADGSLRLSVLSACTSVQNASIALMLYIAIVRAFRPRPRVSEIYALAGVFLSVVALNIGRLVLMAQSVPMFHLVHGEIGAIVITMVITLTGLGWAIAGVRREIFD